MKFCQGLKGEFGSMIIRVVTMSRMRFFWGRFDADFLTTDARTTDRGQRPRGQRAARVGAVLLFYFESL